ncbi:MAG: HYR domain-containing protein, partial [Planctomycetes bacterium]|nr:HYR domain-containing protein [Planctomycetota bacterium]
MKPNRPFLALLAATSFAASDALAQDSVALHPGLPGDAVSAYNTTEQLNNYVVDLDNFSTSWNTLFGIAPLIKTSADSASPATSFNLSISSQGISSGMLSDVPFPFTNYSSWTGQGFGINDDLTLNNPGAPINTMGLLSNQFGLGFVEFNTNSQNPIGSLVNYTKNNPARLYVSRITAAINATNGTCKTASPGNGAIDANGNFHFRADGNAGVACGALLPFAANNLFRVRLLSRNFSAVNVLSNSGPSDAAATDWLLVNNLTTFSVPNIIPQSLAGRPILVGLNFSTTTPYDREAVAGTATSENTALCGGVVATRGNLGYTRSNFAPLGSTLGLGALQAQITSGTTDTIQVLGLGANGAVTGCLPLRLPASNAISDPCTGFLPSGAGAGQNQLIGNNGSVSFNGNATVAVGVDQAGRLLAASTVQFPTTAAANNSLQYIAVARRTPAGVTSWTIAAYSLPTLAATRGKPILDGPGGNVIGYLTKLGNVITGSVGPSISAPAIDAVGNVWFIGAVEDVRGPTSDFKLGLIRAVYDPVAFCYNLELVLKVGQTFLGHDSTTRYKINSLFLNAGTTTNTMTPGTVWGGNVSQAAHLNLDPLTVPISSPASLGGFEIGADIIYDVNGDGNYVTLATDPNTPDQQYKTILYIGSPTALASNDECGSATSLPASGPFPVIQTQDTTFSTSNPTDPVQSCSTGGPAQNGHSVWFTWNAGVTGRMSFSTCGSQYNTVVSVSTGSCGSLSEIACNDDATAGPCSGTTQSFVAFDAVAGTTYTFEVTSVGSSFGGQLTATLAVCNSPSIGTAPTDRSACVGSSTTFSVVATGDPILTYQWRKGGVPIPAATASSFTINPVSAASAGSYDVVVSNGCGSATSTPATLTVQTQPVLTCPSNGTFECTSPAGAVVSYMATATSICGPATPVCNPPSGATFGFGPTTVNCSATDDFGNTATCSFGVTVVDTTAPAISCPANRTVECTSPSGATVTFSATATDVCALVTPVCVPASGSTFAVSATTVTCTATDPSSNSSSCSFTVTVVDTTAPALSCPSSVTARTPNPAGRIVNFNVTAPDACDANPTLSCTPPSGSFFPLATTPVNCTASDVSGNSASCSFNVTVILSVVHCVNSSDPSCNDSFATIQDAINGAAPGDTVLVGAGTYTEQVHIDRSLQFLGVQNGVDACTRSGSSGTETVLSNPLGAIFVDADDVVIDGFTIRDADGSIGPSSLGVGCYTTATHSGYQIRNNIFTNNTFGLYLNSSGAFPSIVEHNKFVDNNVDGPASGNGIYSDQGLSNATIHK